MIARKFLRYCITSLALTIASSGYCEPAKKGLLTVNQQDGGSIKVQLIGDENCHVYLTEDGYPLVVENNLFYYATVDGKELNSTGVRARSISKRTALDNAVLKTCDKDAIGAIYDNMRAASVRKGAGPVRAAASLGDSSRFLYRTFPNQGKQKALIFLVEYPDVPFTLDNPHDYFTRMLNEPGFSTRGATGSANDFFMESSNGQFDPQFDVYGPVRMKNPRIYYGGPNEDLTAYEMVVECCEALDSEIDFREYDRDGDGYIDNIYLFYAGEGESSSGIAETVWPHASRIELIAPDKSFIYDGVKLNSYGVSNEWENGNPDGVGTFCHEFSHVMGLPDLYSTNYSEVFDPGEWSALAYGPYNNEGRTPPLYSAFERYCVGWIDLEEMPQQANITLPPVGTGKAYAVKTNNPDEFFVFENRQQTSWDKYLPYHGMLVWHIDFDERTWSNNAVNNTPRHQRVDIIEADGIQNDATRSGDCFPGTAGITSFTDDTDPSMLSWFGYRQSRPLTNIAETADGLITMKVDDGYEWQNSPTGLHVEGESTSHAITVKWNAAEGATDYRVLIFQAETYLPAGKISIDGLPTNGETMLTIEGLEPGSDYNIYVVAYNGKAAGMPSEVISATTAETGFEDIIPEAYEAEGLSHDSFTAGWSAVEGADGYVLNVYTKVDGAPETETIDFTGGIDALPGGWSSSSNLTYALSGYAGASTPSLRMSKNGDTLESAVFCDGIRSVTFWHRGNGSKTISNLIGVYGLLDGEWKELSRLPIIKDAGGKTCTIDEIPNGCTAIRITYLATESGSLAIDDVVIGHGATKVRSHLERYKDLMVGNVLTAHVEDLVPETEYFYTVKAHKNSKLTLESNEVTVRTAKPSGISDVESESGITISLDGRMLHVSGLSEGEYCTVYNLNGSVVSKSDSKVITLPASGIYLVKAGVRTAKIIVK